MFKIFYPLGVFNFEEPSNKDAPFVSSHLLFEPQSHPGQNRDLLARHLGWHPLCLHPTRGEATSARILAQCQKWKADWLILAGYMRILTLPLIQAYPKHILNIHPSLLPRWRGASPVQRSLEAGDNPVGVTVLYTVSAMDARCATILCDASPLRPRTSEA